MTRPGRRPLLAAAIGAVLLAAVPAAPAQQPKQFSPAFLQGTDAFRRTLFDTANELVGEKPEALDHFSDLNDDPRHTLLIVLGEAGRLHEIPGKLPSFIDKGGALFLATDKPLHGDVEKAVEGLTGYTVAGNTVVSPGGPNYHELNYFPFLRPQEGADPALFRNLVPDGSPASTVATNAPSYLTPNPFGWPSLPVLAALPSDSHEEDRRNFPDLGSDVPFAVGSDVGDNGGRVLLLADHSIFINDMMMRRDNGNVEFTFNCLKWLVEGDEPRTKVLFVEDGKINTLFEVPLNEVPDELADKLLDQLVQHMKELEPDAMKALQLDIKSYDRRNGFNRTFLRWLGENDISKRGFLRGLLVLLAVGVVLYGCYKVGWKARYRSDLQGPLLASALQRLAPAGTVTEERRKALIRGDNLWEPARDLARLCLTRAGARAGAAAPPLQVQGGWLRRWTTVGRVRRLWRLAYGPPVRVPQSEWRRLIREVQELKTAFADGTVQFL